MSLVLNVEILGEYKNLAKATKGAEGTLGNLEGTFKKIGSGIAKTIAGIGVGLGAALASQIRPAIDAASDLGESINAVNVAFEDSAEGILELGENAARGLGLSKNELFGISVQFSAFAKQIAGEGGDVVQIVDDISTRGADFASVFNLEVSDALSKFQSGLAGQSEPLRQFGIDLSAAAVEAYAIENGISDGSAALTEQEKVLARYGLLMEQTAMTQGDFANTSDSLANQQRILKAEFEDLQARVGERLIPVMTILLEKIVEYMPEIELLITAFADFVGYVVGSVVPAIADLIGDENGGIDGVGAALTGLGLAIGIFVATHLPMLFAGNPVMAGAIAGLAALALGMVTVYNNAKKAGDELETLNRKANELAVSNPFLFSATGGALSYTGILDTNRPPTTTGSGIAGQNVGVQGIRDTQVQRDANVNVNVNINRAQVNADDVANAINDKLKSQGSALRIR